MSQTLGYRAAQALLGLMVISLSTLALAGPGGTHEATGAAIALPVGWGHVEALGTVVAINVRTGTIVFQPLQRGPRSVKVVDGTVIRIKSNYDAGLADLQVSDQIRMWGVSQPDGTIVAAHVVLLSRKGQAVPIEAAAPAPEKRGMHGVVLAVSPGTLTLVTDAGQVREVLSAPTVRLESVSSGSEVEENDIVRVEGRLLSDGNVSATRITVEFASGRAGRIVGRITSVVPTASLFVVDDAAFVNVLPGTFILQGIALKSLNDLGAGRAVRVLGAPGVTPFVIKARIVIVGP